MIHHFGIDELRKANVVLPTAEHLPELFQESEWDLRVLLDRVCGYMSVDPETVDLIVSQDNESPQMLDNVAQITVQVTESQLEDSMILIASMACQISWQFLLRENLLDPQLPDQETLSELYTVFRGIGIFPANVAVIQRNKQHGLMEMWSISRTGHLPARMYGYAFALFAWLRGESAPPWSRYLNPDASAAFKGGLKFLSKTGDCLIDPVRGELVSPSPSVSNLVSALELGSESAQISALWDLRKPSIDGVRAIDSICQCLHHANPIIQCEAAETIGAIGSSKDSVITELLSQLNSNVGDVRANSIFALGQLRPSLQSQSPRGVSVAEEFRVMLNDHNPKVVFATVGALTNYGTDMEATAPAILQLLVQSIIRCDHEVTEFLAMNLTKIVSNVETFLNERRDEIDEELQDLVISAIEDANSSDD